MARPRSAEEARPALVSTGERSGGAEQPGDREPRQRRVRPEGLLRRHVPPHRRTAAPPPRLYNPPRCAQQPPTFARPGPASRVVGQSRGGSRPGLGPARGGRREAGEAGRPHGPRPRRPALRRGSPTASLFPAPPLPERGWPPRRRGRGSGGARGEARSPPARPVTASPGRHGRHRREAHNLLPRGRRWRGPLAASERAPTLRAPARGPPSGSATGTPTRSGVLPRATLLPPLRKR